MTFLIRIRERYNYIQITKCSLNVVPLCVPVARYRTITILSAVDEAAAVSATRTKLSSSTLAADYSHTAQQSTRKRVVGWAASLQVLDSAAACIVKSLFQRCKICQNAEFLVRF